LASFSGKRVMSELHLPTGENILMAAYRAVAEGRSDPSELVASYEQHFTSTVPVPPAQPPVFERFSLVDPSIRMTVQSSTATV
jgi:hypothetical protein